MWRPGEILGLGISLRATWWTAAPMAGTCPRDPCYDRAVLWAAGLLFARKLRLLESGWRKDFEDAQERGFTVIAAPGELLDGEAGRRAWYRNAGIPRQLLRRWIQAHRRADKTIRKLTALAPAQ
jgi:hypothetical protein